MGLVLIASLLAGLALGLLLLLEHLFFWPPARRLSPPVSYVVGVLSGWLVFIPLSFALGVPQAAVAYLVMFVVGGAFVAVAYWARDQLAQQRRIAQRQGRLSAESLTQDAIDRGHTNGTTTESR